MPVRRSFGSVRELKTTKRFQARYTGPDKRRYAGPQPFVKKTDAYRWLTGVQAQISNGTWTPPSRAEHAGPRLFADYARAWVEQRKLKPRTRELYSGITEDILIPVFGRHPIGEITPEQVRIWFGSRPQSTPTRNAHAYALLRTILKTATDDELIGKNPCRIEGAGQVKRARTITVLAPEQVSELAEQMPPRLRAMVYVAAYTCVRFGELTELRLSDLRGNLLDVGRGVTTVGGQFVVGTPKSQAGVRTIPLPSSVIKIITDHVAEYGTSDGLLFPAPEGGHLSQPRLYKSFDKARKAVGRPDFAWHALRHTGAVLWAQEGATVKELMHLLGHENTAMAMRYQHLAEGELERVADRLSERISRAYPQAA